MIGKMTDMKHQPSKVSGLPLWLVLSLIVTGLTACGKDDVKEEDETISATEIYDTAKRSMDSKSWGRAIGQFRLLQSRFPFGRYSQQAQLELAYSYYKNYEPELALSTLDRFIKTYPTHKQIDYALYLKGLVDFSRTSSFLSRVLPVSSFDRDLSFVRESFSSFAQLVRDHPESVYSGEAHERMLFLRKLLAQGELEVARYYMRRNAFVAAANRAKYVIETYQSSPLSGDALAIMAEAYKNLELTDLSEDAVRVLQSNFPQHPYLTGKSQDESWLEKIWPF